MKLKTECHGHLTAVLPGLSSMVPYHSVVSAQIPGGDPAQLHGQFLDQPLVSRLCESHSVSGVTSQLLICSNSCQNHLQASSSNTDNSWSVGLLSTAENLTT